MKKSVRYILNGLTLPVFVVGQDRLITFMNKSAKTRYSDARSGHAFSDVIQSKKCLEALDAVLGGKPNANVKITLQEVVPTSFQVSLSRLDGEEEAAPSCVLSFEDISHIQEAEQMRHDFVANVSHELRSPLTAISGFIETLQGPAANDTNAQTRFLGLMEEEADRMARLIADLLSLSKLQASERIAPSGKTDLFTLMGRVLSSLEGIAQKRDIQIRSNLTPDTPQVRGDTDELTQVFQNLVENAVKYSPRGSIVKVLIGENLAQKNHISIDVVDQGEGIESTHIPRLTERFYRVDKGRSRQQGGTGLGLAIVKHILIRHRGWLNITSTPEIGSTFSVNLPKAED